MIAIPNMERPESCWQCYNEGCDHWGEYGYDNSGDCPLIDIVTCGECKWSYTDERDGTEWCKVHMSHYQVNSDGFCSYAERK